MSNLKKKFISVHDLLIEDEKLLRLLHYPPENLVTGQPNPLSEELPNILEKEDVWDIRDAHLPLSSKKDDMEQTAICILYTYPGRARSTRNFMTTKQEIIIDVLTHHSYERELRSLMISDRVSKILFNSRVIAGLGRVDYRTGYPINAPKGWEGYRHIYEVGGAK